MSISQALNTTLSGLRATQAGLQLVAANVANAQTPGYVRKSAEFIASTAGDSGGVRIGAINRELDQYLQRQLRVESAGGSYADLRAEFYRRLQGLYGAPGSDSSLETAFNNFTGSVQALITSPDSAAARSLVLSGAQVLSQTLNSLTDDIQALRADAESGLAEATAEANNALQKIDALNRQLAGFEPRNTSDAALADQRDQYIDQLSQLMDIRVVTDDRNQVSIFTNSGVQLIGSGAARLSFAPQGTVTAQTQWDADPAQSNLGSLMLVAAGGSTVDLVANQSIRSGRIAAYLQMRDQVLVEAQNQIDSLAANMAQALSSQTVTGAAATSGLQTGFAVETAGLLNGNRINLTYTDTVGNVQHRVSIVRVDDPTALPLTNSATADPNDEVVGIDFSGGLASVATQLNALFGPGLQFTATGSVIEVLDDGGGNTTDVNGLTVTQTATTLANGDPALALFTDGASPFTNAITGVGTQALGFAARIAVNPQLLADPTKLVIYGPGTPSGDPTRPDLIFDRLTGGSIAFPANTGFGDANSPYVGNLPDFLRQVLTMQGDAAANASNLAQGQSVVVTSLKERINEASGVNVDQEMTNLIKLQTAYGANARVMAAVREMIDMLLKM